MSAVQQPHQEVTAIRRDNLRRLIEDHDGATNLARKLGLAGSSYLAHVTGPTPIKDIGEKSARHIESSLNLPPGWLDRRHDADQLVVEAVLLVAEVVRKLGLDLGAGTITELALLAHERAAANGGRLEPDHVTRLVSLLRPK